MICRICGKRFKPSQYHPRHQKVCTRKKCQHERHLLNLANWRMKNPDYFKYSQSSDPHWQNMRREQLRKWRKKHPEKIKAYRIKRKKQHREYMRAYMRKYRNTPT
ncbi:MAG: hypothetical protein ABH952_02975 [Candidatus Omnitrophota bacterium]